MKVYVLLGQQVGASNRELYLGSIGCFAYSTLQRAKEAAQRHIENDWDPGGDDAGRPCPLIGWTDGAAGENAWTEKTLFNGEDLEIQSCELDSE